MKVKYDFPDFDPNILHPLNIDRLAVENVPSNSFILDVGCATGFMGKYLKDYKNCKVFGVEIRESEAKKAKANVDKVLIGDIESRDIYREILNNTKNKKFDVILATSVIEHLVNPSLAFYNFRRLLKHNGKLIVSVPNISHWTVRLSLLKGDFEYNEYGILDKTHTHFYTPQTFKKLLSENNFKIEKFLIDPVGGGYPKISLFLSSIFRDLFTYQMLVVATK